jgi:hypothetical protein
MAQKMIEDDNDPQKPECQRPSVTLYALIAAHLEQIGKPHWIAVVLAWLARYEGVNRCYFEDDEDAPAVEVFRCLCGMEPGMTDESVATSLAQLDFLSWRVRHPVTGERWDPLAMSLVEFMGELENPICWRWEGSYPSAGAISEWLCAQLPPNGE